TVDVSPTIGGMEIGDEFYSFTISSSAGQTLIWNNYLEFATPTLTMSSDSLNVYINANMALGGVAEGLTLQQDSTLGTLFVNGNIAGGGNTLTISGAGITQISGNIADAGEVRFIADADATISGAITGTTALYKTGAGTLFLSGDSNYSG